MAAATLSSRLSRNINYGLARTKAVSRLGVGGRARQAYLSKH